MNSRSMGTVLRLLGIGWYVGLCVGGGAAVGFLLDSRLNLTPILTLVGVIVGIAFAGVGMYRMITAVLASSSGSRGDEGGE